MSFRRPSPCKRCRVRHHACFSENPDHSGECLACRRAGVCCEEQKGGVRLARSSPRSVNTTAELRSISLKLGAAIDALQEEGAREDEDPELDDLVERLTAVAFSNDGLDGPSTKNAAKEASDVMAPGTFFEEDDLSGGGFVWSEAPGHVTIDQLIQALPPWHVVEEQLLKWPSVWQSQVDAFMLPTWPRQIEIFYLSGFSPTPHPHQIAELLAFLALADASAAVTISRQPQLRDVLREHTKAAERFMELAFQALHIDCSVLDNPTQEAIGTLQLLASIYIGCWIDHSKLRKGLAILPLATSLIHQMGYNRADVDFPYETTAQRYQRKALVYAVVRMLWVNNPLIARKTAYSPASILFEPPAKLDPNCLPPDPKYQDWMPSDYTVKSLQIRSYCAIMRHELQTLVRKGRKCEYRELTAFATRITRRAGELFPVSWQPFEDPVTRDMALTPLANPNERVARFLAIPNYENLFLALHRSFLTFTGTTGSVDANWHRKELVLACRKQWTAVAEAKDVIGGFLSLCWDIAICSSLLLSPAHAPYLSAADMRHCNQVVAYCINRYKSSGFPYVYRNLARLISFILCRVHPALESDVPEGKKAKRENSSGPVGVPWSKLPMPAGDQKLDLDFTFSMPAHLLAPDEDEEHYVHLSPTRLSSSSSSPISMSSSSLLKSLSRSVSSHGTGDRVMFDSKAF